MQFIYRYSAFCARLLLMFFVLIAVFIIPSHVRAATDPVCCSNVLFLPGFEGSRLYYEAENPFGKGTIIHLGWEPRTNNDVRRLSMDDTGKSLDPTIHTLGIIDSAYGLKGIYRNFFTIMNGLIGSTVNEWTPFAYDWRMSVTDVATGLTPYPNGEKRRLVGEVEHLASTSKTGKVTIVAHSNGGLVAKMLAYELEQEGKSELLDKVILVAVPQLGTPLAVSAMLHGEGQQILAGLVLRPSVARTFGLNVPGSYGLLPSKELFSRLTSPLITLASSTIDTYEAFKAFITGASDGRSQPDQNDLKTPAVVNTKLLSEAEELHSKIDTWQFPAATQVVALAGWGLPTTKSIVYSSSSPQVRKEPDGDSTVITDSASGYSGDTLFFNLGQYDNDTKAATGHMDIFDATPIKDYVTAALSSISLPLNPRAISTYFTPSKPAGSYPWMKWITLSVHSPVDMDIYDSQGRHMGPVQVSYDENPDVSGFDNTIGGEVDMIGEEKYYTVPADETYSVVLRGTGVGSFTFQIQKFTGNNMTEVSNTLYPDLPVTPLLIGTTTVSGNSLSPLLSLDMDGDGATDLVTEASTTPNPLIGLEALRHFVLSLSLGTTTEKHLLKKIDKVADLLAKNKLQKIFKKMNLIEGNIQSGHLKLNGMSQEQKDALITQFEQFLDGLMN